jgi:hypothetical protein
VSRKLGLQCSTILKLFVRHGKRNVSPSPVAVVSDILNAKFATEFTIDL